MSALASVKAVDTNPSFDPALTAYRPGNLQVAWDNTSLSVLRTCPRKYYYQNVLGLRSSHESPDLVFGIHYHKALEVYAGALARGIPREEARNMALRTALKDSWGWESDHKVKNRGRLIRAVYAYTDNFRTDGAKTLMLADGRPATELSFRFELDIDAPTGEPYMLCGHLDRVVRFEDNLYTMDHKTSARTLAQDYIAQFKPSGQMMQYTFAGKIIMNEPIKGVLIDAIQLVPGGGEEFSRFPVSYTEAQLEEWLDNTKFFIKMAEQYAKAGFWPQNTEACHHYSGCQFRDLCGRTPEVRENFLRADFKVSRWDPMKVR